MLRPSIETTLPPGGQFSVAVDTALGGGAPAQITRSVLRGCPPNIGRKAPQKLPVASRPGSHRSTITGQQVCFNTERTTECGCPIPHPPMRTRG